MTTTGRAALAALVMALAARAAEAGEDKYLLVVYDAAYSDACRAEGYSSGTHLRSIAEPVRAYLSDVRRFWLTFTRGFKFRTWDSPRSGSGPVTFVRDIERTWQGGSFHSWAICSGFTGKRSSILKTVGIGTQGDSGNIVRHSVVFYGAIKAHEGRTGIDRFGTSRGVMGHEIGHNFGGRHHPYGSSVTCAMDEKDSTVAGVYRYCGTHQTRFRAYQKTRRGYW